MFKPVLLLAFVLACAPVVTAGTRVEFDFNSYTEGTIDGQAGWKLYDRVMNASAFLIAAEIGTTESKDDNALVVKPVDGSIRCVTDEAVRWRRDQTARAEFDFRLVVPAAVRVENEPAMIFLIGNSMLGRNARWEVRIESAANGDWKVRALIPNAVSATIPVEKLALAPCDQSVVSDWFHCTVEVNKLPETDSFETSVRILDRSGRVLADLSCSDAEKSQTTRALWNLSRLHAGFLADKEVRSLSCIDNFLLTTEP